MKKTLQLIALFITSFSFSQENIIEFITDESFNYTYPNNFIDTEIWEQFYTENTTSNPKPNILNQDIIGEGYINEDIIYDNNNDAYSVSYKYNDAGLQQYSIKKYHIENDSWIEIINATHNLFRVILISGIYKNSKGNYFLTTESNTLNNSNNTDFNIFIVNNSNQLEHLHNSQLKLPQGFFFGEKLHFINDYFYKTGTGLINVENEENEIVSVLATSIVKSVNITTTLNINIIDIDYLAKKLHFENGEFTSKDFKILNIYTLIGQSIPNKNLKKNTTYIILVSDKRGNNYSIKLLIQ